MRDLKQIVAVHTEIDAGFNRLLNEASDRNDESRQTAILDKKLINDNAFFLLVWGQFENEINEICGRLIDAGCSDPDWSVRRLFYNFKPDRMRFEERLSLVLDKQGGRGSPWARAMTYYSLRNAIAHGESKRSGIAILQVIADMIVIQGHMRR